jgi:multidrug efflux system membrane fusion protein
MSATASSRRRLSLLNVWAALLMAALLPVAGCHRGKSAAPAPAPEAKSTGAPQAEGVSLKPDEIEKSGVAATVAVAAMHAPESAGYAVVLTRETIAQAVAELTSAAAVERQSRAALERGRQLAGTPGATSMESLQAAERQAVVDHAALVLAQRRLSATLGRDAPWKDDYQSAELTALASGEHKLARVTFPLGALGSATPATARFAHLGETPGGRSFGSVALWSAPADATIPGRSFFAILKGADAAEGERLLARVPVGAATAGVVVPFSAVVISAGKYWCYLEAKPGLFVRAEIDTSMPTDDGYFVRAGIAPGAKVVTSSAGELLARETNPGSAAD